MSRLLKKVQQAVAKDLLATPVQLTEETDL